MSMVRTPEPELMDDPDQAAAYAAADFATADAALVAHLAATYGPLSGPIVDLGCGPGNITLRLAEAAPDCTVLGLDGAPQMVALAEAAIGPQVAGRLRYQVCRLPATDLPRAAFAGVVCNSLLHHLHDPAVLWSTIAHVGRSGAWVCVGDLRRPASPDEALRLVDRYAEGAPAVLRADYLASLHAAFTVPEVARQLVAAGLASLAVTAVDDRYLRVQGRLP